MTAPTDGRPADEPAYEWPIDFAVAAGDTDLLGIDGPDPEAQAARTDKRDRAGWERAQATPTPRLAIKGETEPGAVKPSGPYPSGLVPVRLDSILDTAPPPLLLDRLDPEGHTVLFGAGGIGKGTLTSSWIVGLVTAGHRVLVLDYERHAGEWRRRIGALGDPETLEHVYHLEPTGALWQHAEAVRAVCDGLNISVVVVDSIVVACAGRDVMDPGTAGLYTQAVASLDRPVLSLGHNTKAGDTRYPFGSVFWHNLARLTWSLSQEAAGVVLACRKSNNYQTPSKQTVAIDWYNDRPQDVRESPYSEAIADMALELLTDEPMSLTQIVDRLNDERDEDLPAIKSNTVRQALKRARALDKCGYRGRGYVR
jgi:hypothetical protein